MASCPSAGGERISMQVESGFATQQGVGSNLGEPWNLSGAL